jgi:hypothetical protein
VTWRLVRSPAKYNSGDEGLNKGSVGGDEETGGN